MQIRPEAVHTMSAPKGPEPQAEAALRRTAQALEASFLAEMLKFSGLGEARESFGGGVGEEQFTSFLCDEYARSMAQAGGVGLAETIFQSLQKGAAHAK